MLPQTYRPSRDNPPELNEFLEDVLKYKDEFKWIRLQLDEVADDDNVVDGNAKVSFIKSNLDRKKKYCCSRYLFVNTVI